MNGEIKSTTRILFVDDSKVMVKTASKMLSAEFDVVTAVDGDDAWGKLGRDPDIAVLFTDINMPNCDGYELLERVRSSGKPGLHDMPVILVTGADDHESAKQLALDRGATDFLNKKFLSTELLTRARAHASYQRISRQLQSQSTLDPLTGMDNEPGFLHRLEQDIAYARRHGQGLALLRVEIDDLVATFHERGNAAVEQIVVHVSKLIRKRIREEDTAAHIGLGGFAIALPGGQREGIEVMAAWLHAQVAANALQIDGRPFAISLRTAVISANQDVWASAQDALNRCQAILDRPREPAAAVPAPAAVKQPQPAAPVSTPSSAATKAPEPATAQPTPTYASSRRDRRRDQPKPGISGKALHVLQRLMSSLRSFGAEQGVRLVRFLKKLVGK